MVARGAPRGLRDQAALALVREALRYGHRKKNNGLEKFVYKKVRYKGLTYIPSQFAFQVFVYMLQVVELLRGNSEQQVMLFRNIQLLW